MSAISTIVMLVTITAFVADVVIWRIRYRRWLRRGFAISEDFALWHERRREWLDPMVAKIDEMTPDDLDCLRANVTYYMRWSDQILMKQVEWEKSAP